MSEKDHTVSKTDVGRIASAENTAIAENTNVVKSEPVAPPSDDKGKTK